MQDARLAERGVAGGTIQVGADCWVQMLFRVSILVYPLSIQDHGEHRQ